MNAAVPGVVPAGEAPRHPPITEAEPIDAKLRGSRGLEVNTVGTRRDAERVTAARG